MAESGPRLFQGFESWCNVELPTDPSIVAAAIFIGIVALLCFLGPSVWPFSYAAANFDLSSEGPSSLHPLGTDVFGRDLLARLLVGLRTSMLLAIISQSVAAATGVALGLVAGAGGHWADVAIMRGVDIFMAVPDILLVILLAPLFNGALGGAPIFAFLSPLNEATSGGVGIVLAIIVTSWMLPTRLVRAQVLSLRESEFCRAAVVTGVSPARLMTSHLLPNVMPLAITVFTLGIPRAILMESAISYLGLGLIPPMPSLGVLIADGIKVMRSHPSALIFPATLLCVMVIGINLIGDLIRDRIGRGERWRL